jgi:hypothetical protein
MLIVPINRAISTASIIKVMSDRPDDGGSKHF